MNRSKQRKLKKAGFKVGSVQEFLGLSKEDMGLIEQKIQLTEKLRSTRSRAAFARIRPVGADRGAI